ncbi:conserved hypothetical protein [delta proteobacterium NaphS2]|nr:conserved hypothetical protein [delta proteobacterium NaphS2]
MEMFIAGRAIGLGMNEGDVERDEEGMMLAKSLECSLFW